MKGEEKTPRWRNAVAMWRVSSREQSEGFSIDSQRRQGHRWATDHGLDIVCEREAVESAKDDGRVVYQELLRYWKSHTEVDVLLVEKVDRLARNKKEYFQAKDFVFENAGKEIHLFKSGRILHRDSPASDWLFTDIEEGFAAHYSLNLSQEVKKGLREKAEQGIYPTTAPFAYVNNKATRNIDPHPQRAPIFTRMAELYATGRFSLDQIEDRGYAEGLRSRYGNKIAANLWWWYFKNPVYAGRFLWEGTLFTGIYQPLYSWGTYEALRKALHRAGKSRGPGWGTKEAIVFRGLGRCSWPGCPDTGHILTGDGPKKNNPDYVYYRCAVHSKPAIRQDRLAKLLGDGLKALEIPDDALEWLRGKLRETHSHEREYVETKVTSLKARYSLLQRYIDDSYIDKLEGHLGVEEWQGKTNKWREEQAQIEGELARTRETNQQNLEDGVRLLELAQRAHSLYLAGNYEEKRELLEILLSNFSFDGVTVSPTWAKPFDDIAFHCQNDQWLGC